ncbi:MAG: PKD domain-containing protein [Chitinophagaceae bacterium]
MYLKKKLTRIILLIVCFQVGAYSGLIAQPIAAFTSDKIQGCNPVEIQFSDQSTANPTNWSWDFGDGTNSTLKNPLKVFSAVGTFTVTLTVSNALGTDVSTKTNLITINSVPIAAFSGAPTQGCFPLTVNFNDLSSSPGAGTISAWKWDFGDGLTSNLQNPNHLYSNFGDYYVALYVENTNGCGTYLNKPAFAKIGDTVKADFDTTMQPYCKLPKTVSFLNASAGSGTFTYNWDFGDGTFSTQTNPVHSYTNFGNYTVKLTATSSYGCSNTVVKTNLVKVDTLFTNFQVPSPTCIGSPVTFTNGSAPATVKSSWNFGDGTSSLVFNPTKIFNTAGSYTITLSNSFVNGCVDSVKKMLVIGNRIPVAFNNTPATICKAPLTVTFTDITPGGLLQSWNFGDGGTATGSSVTHTYTTIGSYSVKLALSTAGGCSDSLTKTNLVVVAPPDAAISLTANGGCVPVTLAPTANVNTVDPVTAYDWDFGDGFTSSAVSPSHTYNTIGVYSLRLIVTTSGGCKDTAFQTIRVGTPPRPGFIISPNPVCARQPVFFTDTSSSGNVTSWDFGDGGTAGTKNATHRYDKAGLFSIMVRVDNGGCIKDSVLNNYLQVLPPAADFTFAQDCNNSFRFSFAASVTSGAPTYTWNFGDGFTTTGASVAHTYASAGNFTVSLIAAESPCADTVRKTILTGTSTTAFKVNTVANCINAPFVFTAHYETPAYVTNYQWDFGDGTVVTSPDSLATHSYTLSGTFTIRLVVSTIFGCADTVSRQNLVVVSGPVAAFSVVNPGGCSQRTVTFTDLSTTDGTHNINNWKWDFGDGTVQSFTTPPFTHVYIGNGIYSVKLVVTDIVGCKDSVTQTGIIKTSKPVISFSANDTVSCPNALVVLIATGLGNNLVYTWNTGVTTLSGDTAVAMYPDSGRYTVKLYVTDGNGCSDSVTRTSYISIKKPKANFSLSDSISICPPLRVRFANNSYYYNRLVWDFDNGNTSFQQNPFVSFPTGAYNVKLKVTSPGGCIDSLIRPVTVYPYTNQFTYQPLTGCQPLAVAFKLSVPTKGTYRWDYNDGSSDTTTDSSIVKKYTSFGPYKPRVFFTETSTGCVVQVAGASIIDVVGTKANFSMSDSVFCGSGTISFTDSAVATGPITHRWNFGDGTFSNQPSPVHTYFVPGRYTVKQIVSSGTCSDTMTKANIIIYPKPNIFITGDSVGCLPFSTTFTPRILQQDTASITWAWNFGNGQTSVLQNPPLQTYPTAGSFTVTLHTVSSYGCISDTSKAITVNPLPAVDAGNDTTVCANTTVTLRASGSGTYTWLPPTSSQLSCINCSNPVATLASRSEWYYVKGASAFGCQAIDSVHVQYLPSYTVTATPPADSLCLGQTAQLIATGAQRYSWTPATALSASDIPNPIASPLVSTTYRLVATDTLGCQTYTQDIPITVFTYPTVNAGPDITISGGSSALLNATASADAVAYKWTPASQLSCVDCLVTTATPKTTTTYVIAVTNNGLCSATDSVTVTVLCNNSNVYIPNTFSPNGDGMNDIFYPRGTGLSSIKSLRVFSRWGEMVFGKTNMTPNDPSQGWNGSYKGTRAASDVYTYIAEVYCENNILITINGTINLIY